MDTTPQASDQRQYSQMQRRLRSFQEGSQTLPSLIQDLEALSGHLQAADEPWKNEFQELWSELDYTHELCVERQSGLTNEEYARIIAAVKKMEAMLLAARTWSELEKQTLRAIVESQRPELLSDLDSGLRSGFTAQQVREIRDTVGDELAESGVTNGEINEWGKICDDFIGRIGPLPL